MTVAELIEELEEYPSDYEVVVTEDTNTSGKYRALDIFDITEDSRHRRVIL